MGSLNILDFIIILVVFYYFYDGYRRGFIRLSLELFGFFLSIFLALYLYTYLANFLRANTNISHNISKVLAFFIILIIFQIFYSLLANHFYRKVPYKWEKSLTNRLSGILPAFFKSLIFLALCLSLFVFIPTLPRIKSEIDNSYFARPLISKAFLFENKFEKVFAGAITDTLTFLTTRKGYEESINLNAVPTNLTVDPISEERMLELINEERKKFNLKPFKKDQNLQNTARKHSEDMWKRNYFAHISPDGKNPFDRLRDARINFIAAGENLALAPSVDLAHFGLMNSPEHRENILSPYFGKIGIGVIDGGMYGKMFTQEFTD